MTVTKADLQDFAQFADEMLAQGESRSLSELVGQWEARRLMEATVADIHESYADIEAARVMSVEDAFAEARKELV